MGDTGLLQRGPRAVQDRSRLGVEMPYVPRGWVDTGEAGAYFGEG